jgi:cytochrome d ubiquinol oxidase subunit I
VDLDPTFLARLQFALTIMFHYLFPPISIGLGLHLIIMEGRYLRTGDPVYGAMARFWGKVFGVCFAMGVATGIVMEFQFGTNWSTYSRFVGDVFGSALAAEGIFAFFLESGFLAVMIFGWDRVSPRLHFLSTVLVALGSIFSAVWIVVANSWQQTPAGYHLVEAAGGQRAEITDFWAVVFNPSSMHRLGHVLLGAFLMGAFFVMSVSAYHLLRRRHQEVARGSFRIALGIAVVAATLTLVSGHFQADKVAVTQPAKLAAFEGHFETGTGGTPLYLLGWPDEEAEEVRLGLAVPGGLSFLLYGDLETPVPGLDQVRPEDRPPVVIPFLTYHVMVALGMLMLGLSWLGLLLLWRGSLFRRRWLLRVYVAAVLLPLVANQTGWVAAEVGRQPWIVQDLLRTSDAVSPAVPAAQILISLVLFGVIYGLLALVWIIVLDRKIRRQGPEDPARVHPPGAPPGVLDSAAELTRREGPSMTSAHEEDA